MPPSVRQSYAVVCRELDRRRRITLGLDRVRALLDALGNPQNGLRVVQVVGTNGKGTTAASLAGALHAAGQPAGAYLSPHVLEYTERVMLEGRFASEEEFARAMGRAIEASDAEEIGASQFELLTAGAIALFRDAGLRWAVMEAGLGARHDATSAAAAEMVVLTNVGLDHTEYLGQSVEEIAREKLASVQEGATLVLGTGDPRVLAQAREACAHAGARMLLAPRRAAADGELRGLAPFVSANVALGVRAAEELLGRTVSENERREALRWARLLPGRFEEHFVGGVSVVVDGGHNEDGVRAALAAVRARHGGRRPVVAVFGGLKDKDLGSMLTVLKGEARALFLTRPAGAGERAADPEALREKVGPEGIGPGGPVVVEDAREAVRRAAGLAAGMGGVVLVVGSLAMGGEVLESLRSGALSGGGRGR